MSDRRSYAAAILAADVAAFEGLLSGVPVPRERLHGGTLISIGEPLQGPDVVIDDELALRVELNRGLDPTPAGVRPEFRFAPIEDFAAINEPGADPLVIAARSEAALRAAIPTSGFVLMYGDGGAGKTTCLLDMAMHFAAGDAWCDLLEPVRPLRIGWIEAEGPRPMMRAKLAAKLATWTGGSVAGRIHVLEEPWAAFTFQAEPLRRALADELRRLEIDLLIAGPLSRLGIEGAGNTTDIRTFLKLVADVQQRLEVPPALAIVHHESKSGDVSGAWDRDPDTLVHVQSQGNGRTRIYWRKVRWASDLHLTTSHLVWADGESFTVDERPEVTPDTIATELLEAVRELPGGSWTKIRAAVTGNATEAAKVRDRLLAAGELVNTAAREGYFKLWLPDDPASGRSELGTGLERLSFPFPGGAPDPSRSVVPSIEGNDSRNGTDTGDPGRSVDEHELDRLYAIGDEMGLT